MPRIDEAVDQLRRRRHRAGQRVADLADRHLAVGAELKQDLDLGRCEMIDLPQLGDRRRRARCR